MTKMTYLEFTAYFTIEFATFFKRKLSSCEISCAQRSPWRFEETPSQTLTAPEPTFITHQADMPRWQAEMTNRLAMTQWQSQCQSQLDSSLETLALRGDRADASRSSSPHILIFFVFWICHNFRSDTCDKLATRHLTYRNCACNECRRIIKKICFKRF